MAFWNKKIQPQPAEVLRAPDQSKQKGPRLVARAKRLRDILDNNKCESKRHALSAELEGILRELGAREDAIKEILNG